MTCSEDKEYLRFNRMIHFVFPNLFHPTLGLNSDKIVDNAIEKLKNVLNFDTFNDTQLKIIQEQASQIRMYKSQTLSIGILFFGGIGFGFVLTAIATSPDDFINLNYTFKWKYIWYALAVIFIYVGYHIFMKAKVMFQICNIIISECMECEQKSRQ